MVEVCAIFVAFAQLVGLPGAILSIVMGLKRKSNFVKYVSIGVAVITIGLYIGCMVTGMLGLSGESYACGWVGFGLGVGCFVLGLLDFMFNLVMRAREAHQNDDRLKVFNEAKAQYNTTPKTNRSTSYIDEIKALKELLDSGALTQEEFDIKKKELLE